MFYGTRGAGFCLTNIVSVFTIIFATVLESRTMRRLTYGVFVAKKQNEGGGAINSTLEPGSRTTKEGTITAGLGMQVSNTQSDSTRGWSSRIARHYSWAKERKY